jgi:hypothetical protein
MAAASPLAAPAPPDPPPSSAPRLPIALSPGDGLANAQLNNSLQTTFKALLVSIYPISVYFGRIVQIFYWFFFLLFN